MKQAKVKFCLGGAITSNCVILLLTILLSAQGIYAQTAGTVSLNVKDSPVENVLNLLKGSYGISFVIKTKGLDLTKTVSISVQNCPLETVIKQLFYPQDVYVAVSGKVVSIELKDNEPVFWNVEGTVIDETGAGIPGATVMVRGTAKGVSTDINGNFILNLDSDSVIECSCLGYESMSTKVTRKTGRVRFAMKASAEFLDELVVVGYGTMKRSLVTSAISKVSIDDSNMRPVTNPAELLNGRVAGVNISTGSGNLGAGERVSIRGASSISAGNEPLYVIDGIPITNDKANLTDFGEDMSALSVLNLSDIESIEILKDAASASIYGSRATNGVVVITTKSGSEGRSNARVNLSTGVSQFPNVGKIRMADSELYLEVFNEGLANYNRQYGLNPGDKGYKEPVFNPFGNLEDTDWLSLVTQLGWFFNADVSFSGGTKKTNYYIGANYNHKEGVIRTNKLEKMNFKVKVNHQFTAWLEVGANASANYMKNYQIPGSNAGTQILGRSLMQRPFDRPYKPDGTYYTGGTDWLTFHNPEAILNEQVSYIENLRYLGSYFINLKFWQDKISFKNTLSTDITQYYDYTSYNENHPYGKGVGLIEDRNATTKNIVIENVLSYNDAFLNDDLGLNVMLGHSFQTINNHNARLQGQGYPSPSFDVVGVASEITTWSGGNTTYAMESWFGRLNLSYKGRYILTASLRTDGSSKFAPAHRWGLFPSVSFGWNISKEPWMQNSSTDLKFRISYGKTGNQEGIGKYAYQAQMGGGKNYNGKSGIYTTEFGNENLTWEKADQFDIGLDISLLKDKITFIVDGYLKNTNDLLYNMPVYGTTGTTGIISNIGSMRNAGVEFSFNTNFDLGPVHWGSSFNISHNRNKITSLPDADGKPLPIGSNRALQVGKEMGTFYLFRHDGIYQYDAEVPQPQYDQGIRAGDIRWYDADGNGIINDSDRVLVGSSNPDFSGGWNNSFSWKGLQLDIFFTYMYGNDVYSAQESNMAKLCHKDGLMYVHAINRWTGPGTTNIWPRSISGDTNNTRNSDFFLHDGSFIRLRTLTLAYNFPVKVTKKMHMQAFRIYAQCDNVFLLTRYPGWDPEVSNNLDPRFFGVDNLSVPQPRTFTFGINVTF